MPVTPATRDRKSRVRFNRYTSSLLQPGVFVSRNPDQIALGERAKTNNVVKIPGVGWRLKPLAWHSESEWELTDAQVPIAGTVPDTLLSFNARRAPALTGVTPTGDAASTSSQMYLKQVADGDSWESTLAADQASFETPPPQVLSDTVDNPIQTVNLDRVFVGDELHEPNDEVNFKLQLPGTVFASIAGVAGLYFTGPAGLDSVLEGFGQYCMIVSGGGMGVLYERGKAPGDEDIIWAQRTSMRVCSPTDKTVKIKVNSDCNQSTAGSWTGRKLTFTLTNMAQGNIGSEHITASPVQSAANWVDAEIDRCSIIYEAPGSRNRAITLAPIRIDVRRDVRAAFGVYGATLPTEGTIEDQPIDLGMLPINGGYLFVDMFYDHPTGTDIDFSLITVDGAASGTVLSGTVLISDELGKRIRYTLPTTFPIGKQFRAKMDFTGTGSKGPTLKGYTLSRQPLIEAGDDSNTFDFPARTTGSGPALPRRSVMSTQISGPSLDPASESANLSIADITGELPQVRMRTGTPLDIDVTTDAGVLTSRLFRGIIQTVGSVDMVPGGSGYPSEDAYKAEIALTGMFRALNRRLAPARIALWDVVANKPLYVTDAIKLLLNYAGVPDSEISIPFIPIRLLGSDESGQVIEPDTPLGDLIQNIASEYLGGAIYYCPNSGSEGMWRLLRWPRPPYNVVLRFDPERPSGAALRHVLGAYGTTTASNGQVIQTLPTFRPRRPSWEPPEGNMVVVIGGTPTGSDYGAVGGAQLVQVLVNVDSYNALGLSSGHANYPDPDHPDFLRECVPIVVRDSTLTTPNAVNFVARRVFDAACHARELLSFNSLLPFIDDVTDDDLTLVRPPRFGDMVEVKQPGGSWKLFCVSKCSPNYRKAHMMRADYELVRTALTDSTLAVPLRGYNPAKMTSAFMAAVRTTLGFGTTRQVYSGNAAGSYIKSLWGGLPAATMESIQDLDPDSPTFGQFNFMAGYDPIT